MLADTPRVRVLFHVAHGELDLRAHLRLGQNKVSPHIHDELHVLNPNGTASLASLTRSAGPDRFLAEDAADKVLVQDFVLLFHILKFFADILPSLIRTGARSKRCSFKSWMRPLGVSSLPGIVSRALFLAAAAFGAGISVEELFPAKLLYGIDAEGFGLFVFEVHLIDDARGTEVAKVDVRNRAEDVKVLRARNIVDEEKKRREMNQPENAENGLGRGLSLPLL